MATLRNGNNGIGNRKSLLLLPIAARPCSRACEITCKAASRRRRTLTGRRDGESWAAGQQRLPATMEEEVNQVNNLSVQLLKVSFITNS